MLTDMLIWQGLALAWPKVPEYQMAELKFIPPCNAPACMMWNIPIKKKATTGHCSGDHKSYLGGLERVIQHEVAVGLAVRCARLQSVLSHSQRLNKATPLMEVNWIALGRRKTAHLPQQERLCAVAVQTHTLHAASHLSPYADKGR